MGLTQWFIWPLALFHHCRRKMFYDTVASQLKKQFCQPEAQQHSGMTWTGKVTESNGAFTEAALSSRVPSGSWTSGFSTSTSLRTFPAASHQKTYFPHPGDITKIFWNIFVPLKPLGVKHIYFWFLWRQIINLEVNWCSSFFERLSERPL